MFVLMCVYMLAFVCAGIYVVSDVVFCASIFMYASTCCYARMVVDIYAHFACMNVGEYVCMFEEDDVYVCMYVCMDAGVLVHVIVQYTFLMCGMHSIFVSSYRSSRTPPLRTCTCWAPCSSNCSLVVLGVTLCRQPPLLPPKPCRGKPSHHGFRPLCHSRSQT